MSLFLPLRTETSIVSPAQLPSLFVDEVYENMILGSGIRQTWVWVLALLLRNELRWAHLASFKALVSSSVDLENRSTLQYCCEDYIR